MRGHFLTEQITLVTETCCNCGVMFAMTESFKSARLKDGGSFYCPAGHGQHYTDSLEAKNRQLQENLDGEKRRREAAQRETERVNTRLETTKRQLSAQKGQVTKLKNRAANGVCPCCNRYFANVHRHMATKHPDFAAPEVEGGEA